MSEQYPIDFEIATTDELLASCFDLQVVMRKQQQRSMAHDRAKARLVLERHGILTGNTPAQQKQIIDSHSTDPGVMRRRLRHNFMVPLGTRITGDGHSIAHFWSVYEADESLNQKQPTTIHLVADEIARETVTGSSESSRLYDIFMNSGMLYVFHNGQILPPEQFDGPHKVVQAARELYP